MKIELSKKEFELFKTIVRLIDKDLSKRFEKEFLTGVIDEKWDDFLVWVFPKIKDDNLEIEFR
ncbi:MAG: hypothetical protein Q4P29_07370 [Tissierellia bacterium]|nr:hypothetical protein [Tissierellia bacterium]